jgi:hypothetical protein
MTSSVDVELQTYLRKITSSRLVRRSIFNLLILFNIFSFITCHSHGTLLSVNSDLLAINADRDHPRDFESRDIQTQCEAGFFPCGSTPLSMCWVKGRICAPVGDNCCVNVPIPPGSICCGHSSICEAGDQCCGDKAAALGFFRCCNPGFECCHVGGGCC